MNEEAIDARLRVVIGRARLPIDERCGEGLDRLVAYGIARMRSEAAFDAAAIDMAADHLRLLLDDMTQQSRILRFEGLHEPNLISALERLCPLWPYC